MNQNHINSSISQLGYAAQSVGVNSTEPQPTDMQTHIKRAYEANSRLNSIHLSLANMLERLCGEGPSACGGIKAEPRATGLSSELADVLSSIESVASDLDYAVTRLSKFA